MLTLERHGLVAQYKRKETLGRKCRIGRSLGAPEQCNPLRKLSRRYNILAKTVGKRWRWMLEMLSSSIQGLGVCSIGDNYIHENKKIRPHPTDQSGIKLNETTRTQCHIFELKCQILHKAITKSNGTTQLMTFNEQDIFAYKQKCKYKCLSATATLKIKFDNLVTFAPPSFYRLLILVGHPAHLDVGLTPWLDVLVVPCEADDECQHHGDEVV